MALKQFFYSLFLFIISVSLLLSCQGNSSKDIQLIGEWEITSFDAKSKSANAKRINETRNQVLNSTFIFKKDSTYQNVISDQIPVKNSKWSLQNDNLELIEVTELRDIKTKFKVDVINKNKLSFRRNLKDGFVMMTLEKK